MDYYVLWDSRLLWDFVDLGFKRLEIIKILAGKKFSKTWNNFEKLIFFDMETKQKYGFRDKTKILTMRKYE